MERFCENLEQLNELFQKCQGVTQYITMVEEDPVTILTTSYYNNLGWYWLKAMAIVAVFILLAQVIYSLSNYWGKYLTRGTTTGLDNILIDTIEEPFVLFIVLIGVKYALESLYFNTDMDIFLTNTHIILIIINTLWLILRVYSGFAQKYLSDEKSAKNEKKITSYQRILLLIIVGLILGYAQYKYKITQCPPTCAGVNLNSKDFKANDLARISFVESKLQNADFSQANLKNADFSGANLSNANLNNADLSGAFLIGANLSGADLTGVNLRGANLRAANLTGADLTFVNLTDTQLQGAIFNQAKMVGVNMSNQFLTGSEFIGAILNGADLHKADLSGAIFSQADLSGANLENTYLYGVWFNRANLNGANLYNSTMDGSSLIGADLVAAQLISATLIDSILIGSDFSGANLQDADLTNTIMDIDLTSINKYIIQSPDETLQGLNETEREALNHSAIFVGVERNEITKIDPTPTFIPTTAPTPTPTLTPTPEIGIIPTKIPTDTPIPVLTVTPTSSPTFTPTPQPTPTSTFFN